MNKLVFLLGVGVFSVPNIANTQDQKQLEWWVEQDSDSSAYFVVVDASLLSPKKIIGRAICEVAFLDDDGKERGRSDISVPVPINSGERSSKRFELDDDATNVRGILITARIERIIVAVNESDVEVVRQPAEDR